MRELKQSTAANVMVWMADSADHLTGKTGLTLTITASKDGAAFGSITPTVTERGSGWYNLALTSSHTDTLGDLVLHITSSGADATDLYARVIAWDKADAVSGGLSRLDATVGSRATQTSVDTIDDFVDTEVAAILAAVDTEVGAIKAKTDNLPSDPADASDIAASHASLASTLATIAGYIDTEVAAILAAVDTEVGAIKAKTDNLPADPASEATVAAKASQTSIDTIDDFLDTEIATLLAVTAAIQGQTDLIPAAPAATGDAMTLTAGERNAVADATLDRTNAVETGLTLRGALRLVTAALAGKLAGAETTTVTIRNTADSKTRITATVDADGNRTAVSTDVT